SDVCSSDLKMMRQILGSLIDEAAEAAEKNPERRGGTSAEETDAESLPLVVGLPLRSEDEEIALQMLEMAMADQPCRFEALSEERLLSERIAEVEARSPVAVCLSTFPPGDLSYVREVCK